MKANRAACVDSSSSGLDPAMRTLAYAVLARGFSYPDADVIEFFRKFHDADTDAKGHSWPEILAMIENARSADPDALRSAYLGVFDPVAGPFPYESEHKKFADEFGKAHHMADLMGFYRAFGVQPARERPDHIAAELEYMHYLTVKEAHAQEKGEGEHASVCREAQEKFLRDHLTTWTDSLLERMDAKADGEDAPRDPKAGLLYRRLADLLRRLMNSEKEALK